jgi:hypothetical protein
VISFVVKTFVFRLKTLFFLWILVVFEVDIVVPESHLIYDVRFWADIEGGSPTSIVCAPTMDVVRRYWILWVYSLLAEGKIRSYGTTDYTDGHRFEKILP